MSFNRREFIQTTGATALLAGTGCNHVPEALRFGRRVPDPPAGPYQVTKSDRTDLITHALNRLTFGARPWDYQRVSGLAAGEAAAFEKFVEEQLRPEAIDDPAGDNAARRFETLQLPPGELFEYQEELLQRELTEATILRAVSSERQLFEVMVQFWSDHFNIDPSKGDCKWLKTADDRDVIRQHALGRFPELLRASALSPAMLWYLDGRVNRRSDEGDKPNENYARELLELHTLGVNSGYTQRDVMEVARCLTGWTIHETRRSRFGLGEIEFKPGRHDRGAKEVLGERIAAIPDGLSRDEQTRRGEAELTRVLELLAGHAWTAKHLATKLCRRFIADEPPALAVTRVAQAFSDSRGDIRTTLRALFQLPEFQQTRGNKLKRPFHYVVSALRATNARADSARELDEYLVRMGHAPFQYPTPDGYPEEAGPWLGTLLWRWNFAQALCEGEVGRVQPALRAETLEQRETFAAGVDDAAAFLLGRRPAETELATIRASGQPLTLLLASPDFQMC